MTTLSSKSTARQQPGGILGFLTRRRGGTWLTLSDVATYLYLLLGTVVMFGPVLWLVLSSFKPIEGLYEFPPSFLPTRRESVVVEGYDKPLELYDITFEDGTVRRLAQVSRVGLEARMIDPANPAGDIIKVKISQRTPVRSVYFDLSNYTEAIAKFPFMTYLNNSLIVTITATALTLLINSMAAFALSKYQFRGRDITFMVIISTLMVPVSVILIPAFLVLAKVGWVNSLWGLIVPGAATPTGVFLLRQYMLTIPDELLDSARIDGASEWRIYWQIILPLAAPALAVLAIFSVMWRWNDFLWPLIVVSRSELFTLQVGLNSFQGELNVQWNYILAMTVLTLLPITLVFALLERYISTGIATTGMK
ncbi:MAG: carbohydrate ABC transporter permease [Chloroflexi bacterium]|nr:carbohydrate ABC transporter permease [Chloroflexota bacterium]MBU1748930.1 carbohydrate ABC transporter permease [Chloroflexota bacterium]MBU1878456.1 carbohydrate ABC transporter permease [Chloroflexota bacterium]